MYEEFLCRVGIRKTVDKKHKGRVDYVYLVGAFYNCAVIEHVVRQTHLRPKYGKRRKDLLRVKRIPIIIVDKQIRLLRPDLGEKLFLSFYISHYRKIAPFLFKSNARCAVDLALEENARFLVVRSDVPYNRVAIFSESEEVEKAKSSFCCVGGYHVNFEIGKITIHKGHRWVVSGEAEYADAIVCLTVFTDDAVAEYLVAQPLVEVKENARHTSLFTIKSYFMKAAILETINAPLVVGDVELTPLSFGQVLVKILVSGFCGSQLQEIAGNKGNAKFVPHMMGHEGCGIVEEVGHGVTRVKKGDKVVMHWRKGEGIESDFPTYTYKGKMMRSGKVTSLSEYSVVSENRITPVPHETPNELCALLGCSLSTALGTINQEADVKFGESVLIVGAGGLGVNLIQAAKLAGAYPIVIADITENKRDTCLSMGAHLFVNSKTSSIAEEIQKAFNTKEIDAIIDTSGNKKAIEDTIPLLSGVGRYIMVGQPKPGESIELHAALHLFNGEGKTIKATQGGRFTPSKDILRYVALHKSGILKTDGIITHRMKLNQINEVITLVRTGQAGRILIEM